MQGLTFRRDENRKDVLRAESAEKRPVILGIRVKNVEFQEFATVLRITGIIEHGEIGLGSYHTINVEPGKDILLIKQEWSEGMKKLLEEALNAKRLEIVFVAIDDGSAVLATITGVGVKALAEISAHISGKFFDTKKENEKVQFYEEVKETLLRYVEPNTVVAIIGPGFWKEEFLEYLKAHAKEIAEKSTVFTASNSGVAGINEVLRKELNIRGLNEARVKIETDFVERFFMEIARNGNVAYGFSEVARAVELGAAETLLITIDLIRKREFDSVLKNAAATRCRIVAINTQSDAGRRFASIGGIGALLRYKIYE